MKGNVLLKVRMSKGNFLKFCSCLMLNERKEKPQDKKLKKRKKGSYRKSDRRRNRKDWIKSARRKD